MCIGAREPLLRSGGLDECTSDPSEKTNVVARLRGWGWGENRKRKVPLGVTCSYANIPVKLQVSTKKSRLDKDNGKREP